MPIKYKIDVLDALKKAGYSSYKIRQEKLLGERVLSRLRHQESVSYDVLGLICKLLNCQPGDLLEYVPDDADKQAK
ncbi:MAG: helix-turn-helix transcriptional regulator [Lachnospiraceae bacterium]|nr:helix-turn-helix transcriptional regulator [Ruminococcus sp.]MCM1277024.1 helix-turn-helix transcriptional regulator [Lachnospiraceae bacterium]